MFLHKLQLSPIKSAECFNNIFFRISYKIAACNFILININNRYLFLALDPPGGTWENSSYCISWRDAEYVEIIHTFISGGMLIYPYGHVDFYPNGGGMMPGCLSSDYWCSHSRAYEYFAESIGLENAFVGQECRDYEEMRYYGGCKSLNRTLQMGGNFAKNV